MHAYMSCIPQCATFEIHTHVHTHTHTHTQTHTAVVDKEGKEALRRAARDMIEGDRCCHLGIASDPEPESECGGDILSSKSAKEPMS